MSDSSVIRQPATPELKRDVWLAFSRSVRDNTAAEFIVQGLRIGGTVLLARLLIPRDFGLFRVLVVVSLLGVMLADVGFPDALVQRKDITPVHESTAWWVSLALATFSAAILYIAAPAVMRIMAMPGLATAIRLICLPVLLEGTAVTANARLRRKLQFRLLAAADVIGEIAFLVTALVLLWLGHPRLSLAGALAARLSGHALTIWIADFHIPLVMPRVAAARDLGRFAFSVLGANLAICLAANADYLMVGRLLGATALGYYSISWDLLRFLPARLHKVAVRVIFPAFSRLQDDNLELTRAYSQLCGYLARIVLPFVACIAVAAPEVLRILYGPQWTPAAAPLRLLAFGLALCGLREGMGAIFYAKNRPEMDIYLNTTRLVLIIITVGVLAPAGLFGVSAGMSILEGGVSIAGQYMVCMLIGMSAFDLVTPILPGLGSAAWCVLATAAGKLIAFWAGLHGPIVLPFVAIPPAIVFLVLQKTELNRVLSASIHRGTAPPIEA
jgi:O-antigen/teichoic acid export membrane protein